MRRPLPFLASLWLLSCVGDAPSGGDAGKQGELNGPCFSNGTCNSGLVCVVPNTCVNPKVDGGGDSGGATDGGDDAAADCPTTHLFSWWKAENNPTAPSYGLGPAGDGAFVLTGSNSLDGQGSLALLTGWSKITIEGTVLFQDTAKGVILSTMGSSQNGFTFDVNMGHLRWSVPGSSVQDTAVNPIPPNTWHHVAVTVGGSVSFYIDGKAEGSVASGGGWSADKGLRIGARPVTNQDTLTGSISDLAIYTSILTFADIQGIASNSITRCR
jgi:hypothetical protein